MQVVLALPAYNEERALPLVLAAFQREVLSAGWAASIVVVDDGSTDGTCRVAQEWSSRLPVTVVRHAANRGLGETIADALRAAAATTAPDDVIVSMDADNTHSPQLIPAMVRRIAEGSDVVIASRYRRGSKTVGVSAFRQLMSYGARFLLQVLLPMPGVRDFTCGFRAYRAGLVQQAFERYHGRLITERSFACMLEILLKLREMGARMCEVPMVLRYDLKAGASKMRVRQTVLTTVRLALRHRISGPAGPSP
jgi:dolichol-phosphate mannosyltransferase